MSGGEGEDGGQGSLGRMRLAEEEEEDVVVAQLQQQQQPSPSSPSSSSAASDDNHDDAPTSRLLLPEEEGEPTKAPGESFRCDLARGLVRIEGGAVRVDPAVYGIPFMVAFEMLEFTTLPRLLLDLVWVLNNIKGVTEKGEKGAFIQHLPGLQVVSRSGGKSIIYRVTGQDRGAAEQLAELGLQIRMYEVSAPGRERRDGPVVLKKERFATVVALSPLAFSLRHAAYITTRSIGRVTQADAQGADERRRVWSQVSAFFLRGAAAAAADSGRAGGDACAQRAAAVSRAGGPARVLRVEHGLDAELGAGQLHVPVQHAARVRLDEGAVPRQARPASYYYWCAATAAAEEEEEEAAAAQRQ